MKWTNSYLKILLKILTYQNWQKKKQKIQIVLYPLKCESVIKACPQRKLHDQMASSVNSLNISWTTTNLIQIIPKNK